MNIVVFGAHPDDCEAYAGGTSVKWSRLGHKVLFVSMTNGDAGHHEMGGGVLARRRAAEAKLSAQRGGVESKILDHHDGELMPTLESRKKVIRIIREWRADIVLSHRPCDYHPDHRYTSILVQDASFMVTVPNCCPESPRLEKNPFFFYMMDAHLSAVDFRSDIAVAIDDAMDAKWDMFDAMESQVYEWLPWLDNMLDRVPSDSRERKEWLKGVWDSSFLKRTEEARETLASWYGPATAKSVRYTELFEVCPYGPRPSPDQLHSLFPFFPEDKV